MGHMGALMWFKEKKKKRVSSRQVNLHQIERNSSKQLWGAGGL